MSLVRKLWTICLLLGIVAAVAACGAQESAGDARQRVGEALIGEEAEAPAITQEDVDEALAAAMDVGEVKSVMPFEICGNSIDDDGNGEIDADDRGCAIPEEPMSPLPEEFAERMGLVASDAQAQDGEQCKITVALLKIDILDDNEVGDDEFFFDVVALGSRARFPATGEYVVPSGSTLPHSITVNTTVGTLSIGKKGQGVPVDILAVANESDTTFNDLAIADTTVVSNCPSTIVTTLRPNNITDDMNAELWFSVVWDP